MRNLEFCKKSRFYPIPMGFTTVTHMCIFGLVSWSALGSNIVWIMGKTSFINKQNPFHESNYKTTTTRKTFRIRLIHQMVWPVAAPDFFFLWWGIGRAKCDSEGQKSTNSPNIADFGIFFLPSEGGVDKEPPTGGKGSLSPLDAKTRCGNNHIMLQVKG